MDTPLNVLLGEEIGGIIAGEILKEFERHGIRRAKAIHRMAQRATWQFAEAEARHRPMRTFIVAKIEKNPTAIVVVPWATAERVDVVAAAFDGPTMPWIVSSTGEVRLP